MAAKKPFNWWLWTKMLVGGGAICIGGPALTMYLTPTDEQLFKKYNPDLQRKSLERRHERQQEFDDFVTKLKEYSKSDKPIWTVQAEEAAKARQAKIEEDLRIAEGVKARKAEMRKEAGLPPLPAEKRAYGDFSGVPVQRVDHMRPALRWPGKAELLTLAWDGYHDSRLRIRKHETFFVDYPGNSASFATMEDVQERLKKLGATARTGYVQRAPRPATCDHGTLSSTTNETARSGGDDKKLQTTLKKLNVQPIQAIEEVNMFKADGNVLHFAAPKVHAAVPANTFAIYGAGEDKELTELVPGILNQLGPDSLASLRKLAESYQSMQKGEKEADDDEIPDLVAGENFESKVE
ncbi:hypothetical protein P8C59_009398 [Phyllachora maydis]|uniref:Nascent polypeptide-associated complex subunit beta n=1 Tax=Phyllachora maydis TaxID=1825666 RepID=A0AAD9MID5_9PEZI|nr:hypothetical protein P8C59_009398 [Phyllachora maydis]